MESAQCLLPDAPVTTLDTSTFSKPCNSYSLPIWFLYHHCWMKSQVTYQWPSDCSNQCLFSLVPSCTACTLPTRAAFLKLSSVYFLSVCSFQPHWLLLTFSKQRYPSRFYFQYSFLLPVSFPSGISIILIILINYAWNQHILSQARVITLTLNPVLFDLH